MPEIEYFTSLGVGGILAGLIFFFYRKDVSKYTEQWRGQSELVIEVVKENTQAITENTETTREFREELKRNERG